MQISKNAIFTEQPDGTYIFKGSAETTETGERVFACAAGVIVTATADSEAIALVPNSRALAKGLGARAIAFAPYSQAAAYNIGAIAIALKGKATAFLGGTVHAA